MLPWLLCTFSLCLPYCACFDGSSMVVLHTVNNFVVHLNHIRRCSSSSFPVAMLLPFLVSLCAHLYSIALHCIVYKCKYLCIRCTCLNRGEKKIMKQFSIVCVCIYFCAECICLTMFLGFFPFHNISSFIAHCDFVFYVYIVEE